MVAQLHFIHQPYIHSRMVFHRCANRWQNRSKWTFLDSWVLGVLSATVINMESIDATTVLKVVHKVQYILVPVDLYLRLLWLIEQNYFCFCLEKLLDQLSGATYFTKDDPSQGFHTVSLSGDAFPRSHHHNKVWQLPTYSHASWVGLRILP